MGRWPGGGVDGRLARSRLSLAEIVRECACASERGGRFPVFKNKRERYHLTTKQHRRRRSSSAYSTLDSPREVSSYTHVHEHATMT